MKRALAALGVLSALHAAPAAAFETLDDIACVCVQDVINTGDYVSCVSHLSRRLVVKEAITREERSDAVSEASSVDLEALAETCSSGSGGSAIAGWGVSLETDSPFYRADPLTGEPAVAAAVLRQWNFTEQDGYQATQNGSQTTCQYQVVIRDRFSRIVRQDFPTCGRTFFDKSLLSGESAAIELEIPLAALNAETGLFDGEPLPPQIYRIEATWSRQGPQEAPDFITEGGLPAGIVAVRVTE